MLKIAMLGHSGCYNRGCEAILRCTVDLILKYVPETQFNVISYFPETDHVPLRDYIECGIIKLSDPVEMYIPPKTPRGLLDRAQRILTPGFPSRLTYVNRGFVHEAPIVFSIGGDRFTDEFWSPRPHFRDLKFASRLGKKTVIWGASIGPFHDPRAEKEYAEALRRVDLITVRDSESADYLTELGVVDNVVRVADPAFTLAPEPVSDPRLEKKNGTYFIGLGVSALATGSYANKHAYEDAFASLGNRILEDSNARIMFIPHVTGNPGHKGDDEGVCRCVLLKLQDQERAFIVDLSFTAGQMKYAISKCEAFVGSRTHSTIAAFSSGVPTISVGSTQKVYGINRDLFGHTDYVLPVDEVTAENLLKKYEHLSSTSETARSSLNGQTPRFQVLAHKGVEAMCERFGLISS